MPEFSRFEFWDWFVLVGGTAFFVYAGVSLYKLASDWRERS